MRFRLLLLGVIYLMLTECSQFALLTSGTGFVASQNAFVKIYNGSDLITVLTTDKDIKTHIYEKFDTHFSHSNRNGIKNSSP